ncbi:MAG: hypothetical protein HQL38_07910 [Alphaproteobacteria bacterium]|nr:hypothetical protein [Alphaproteobacteria bacterium]
MKIAVMFLTIAVLAYIAAIITGAQFGRHWATGFGFVGLFFGTAAEAWLLTR